MKKFFVKCRRIAWHEDEIWAADEGTARALFLKQWTENLDYCPSTEVDDEIESIEFEEEEDDENQNI